MNGTALISDAIDRIVAGQDLATELDEEPYLLPKSLKASMPYLLPVISRGRLVFNGRVIGMHGDPLPRGPRPAESVLADVIGISTVALTADGEIVLVRQTFRNVGSPMLLAPSGSGSLHPKTSARTGGRSCRTWSDEACSVNCARRPRCNRKISAEPQSLVSRGG